ncbi:putative WD40/YVTN repeat-like-containing domain superfamily [Plasmopara halstedii]
MSSYKSISTSGLTAQNASSTPAKGGSMPFNMNDKNQVLNSPSFLSPEPAQKPHNKLTLSGQPVHKIKSLKYSRSLAIPSRTKKTTKKLSHKIKKTKKTLSMATRVLEDISNRRDTGQTLTPPSHDPSRKLEFPTPVKQKPKSQKEPVQSSCSSSASSSSNDQEYSSDEAEVMFDATTIGNMRVVRESLSQSPALSTASSALSMAPVGLEYHFSVSSTVSSVAVAPDGSFLVVGFYNGMVYLYPLTKDSLLFRRGVLLDQIMPRGMYTQIMVTVIIPEDGKFIFAGVYRGSTDIRAFEIDSITLPSPSEALQSTTLRDDDDDTGGSFALPTAKVIVHTYSDAKLKGFAAAKSVYLKGSSMTEYRLLCGLGIKNVHMWRFYQRHTVPNEWTWECVFDKQTNGISLELIAFHPTIANQFLSKSEHQNVRIWQLDEDYEASNNSVTIKKKSHTDIKQTLDTVAVYGDYAYGGSESLAVVDLYASTRMELDLPLSTLEQRAQREAALTSKNASSLRAWNPRGSRRRGAEDMSAQRHMRTVSKLAGQDSAPFTVGMCSDGSVFFHSPKPEMGLATPLEYIEGYEQFFVDPSLDFQAQFSDLTRVNTSGLLAVLPLSTSEKENWMIVAANQEQLVVRSLNAFLHCSQHRKEYSQITSSLKNVMRDLGGEDSSGGKNDTDKSAIKDTPVRQKKTDRMTSKRERSDASCTEQESERKRSRHEKIKYVKRSEKVDELKTLVSKKVSNSLAADDNVLALTTPMRRTLSTSTASPVVSISSSSGSSNPTTPIHSLLSQVDTHLLALKAPPTTIKQESVTTVMTQISAIRDETQSERKENRMKAQALFTDTDDGVVKEHRDNECQSPKSEDVAEVEPSVTKQAEPAEEDDVELDKQLKQLEQYEPEIHSVPFVSDQGSLLAATMYQYVPLTTNSVDVTMSNAENGDAHGDVIEQTNLLLQFAHQNERLKMNFLNDRDRVYKRPDCGCVLHAKRGSTSAINWRRRVVNNYLKRKQLDRRHKKQLASKLQQLHARYAIQIQELYATQQMQANALRARQQFRHMHRQLCNKVLPTVASPVNVSAVPDHLTEAKFPYPNLLS